MAFYPFVTNIFSYSSGYFFTELIVSFAELFFLSIHYIIFYNIRILLIKTVLMAVLLSAVAKFVSESFSSFIRALILVTHTLLSSNNNDGILFLFCSVLSPWEGYTMNVVGLVRTG